MKIAFFDTKPYDIPSFDKFSKDNGIKIKYFETMNSELIPNNSLLREFIGGSIFE